VTNCLRSEIDARGVARLTLQRPEQHNAFDNILAGELRQALASLAGMDEVRVVILSGDGTTFCAGADLAYMQSLAAADEARNLADALAFAELFHALDHFPKPTIARVNGHAFGGGVGLIACCDIAVAADSALFALTEVRMGLVPATISPYVLRAIGARFARRWFLTAERLDANRAAQIGLIHDIAPAAKLDACIDGIVNELLKGGPQAQREAKELAREAALVLDAGLVRSTAQRLARLRVSAEGQEGIRAFLERRRPSW
jgi:methylglutaconyl-CoA hydratase